MRAEEAALRIVSTRASGSQRAAEARRLQATIPETERALEDRLESARAEVAAAKEHHAANQTSRRALEKDLPLGRLEQPQD